MKWFCLPVVLGASLALAGSAKAPNPQLEAVKTVYLLPMSNGLDQYLANAIDDAISPVRGLRERLNLENAVTHARCSASTAPLGITR